MVKIGKKYIILLFVLSITFTSAFNFETGGVKIIEPVEDGLVTVMSTDKAHFEIHEGDHYFVKTYTLNNGLSGSVDYFSFATNGAKEIHAKALLSPDADVIITIYEGGNTTGGITVLGINNDRNSDNNATLDTVAAPTIITLGSPIWVARNGGGKNPVGVSPGLNYEIIAKINTTYIFEIEKQTPSDTIVDVDFWWYEESF